MMNFLVGAVLLLGVIILVHRSLSPQIYKRILHFLHAAFLGKKHPDIILTGSILENFNPFYKKLSPAGKERFIKKCFSFLFNKEFIGCEGLEVTDEMRACIAGTAAQISFGLKNSSFSYYHTIKIFPESFYSRQLDQYLKGGASTNGVLYFSWKDFKEGYSDPTDKYNLGLHEMAHSLRLQLKYGYDFDSRFADYSDRWESIALPEFEKMNQEHISFLRDYGKVNREEFFAVCVEHFFEAPENFRISLPDIYNHLCFLLNIDPANSLNDYALTDEQKKLVNSNKKLVPFPIKVSKNYKYYSWHWSYNFICTGFFIALPVIYYYAPVIFLPLYAPLIFLGICVALVTSYSQKFYEAGIFYFRHLMLFSIAGAGFNLMALAIVLNLVWFSEPQLHQYPVKAWEIDYIRRTKKFSTGSTITEVIYKVTLENNQLQFYPLARRFHGKELHEGYDGHKFLIIKTRRGATGIPVITARGFAD